MEAAWAMSFSVLAAALLAITCSYFRALKRVATSLRMASFFLWYGPQGFLRLKERSGKDTFTIGRSNMVVFNLSIIKHCLVVNPHNYDKGGRAARLMGEIVGPRGILGALDEVDHKNTYQVLNPHTKRADRLQDFEDLVQHELGSILNKWSVHIRKSSSGQAEVDLYMSFNEIFFKVLYQFMFGMELSKPAFHELIHVISNLERFSAVVGFVPAKLLPFYKRYRKDVPALVQALDKIVDNIVQQAGPAGHRSPLSELLHPSSDVTRSQLKDTVKNLLFAGATTAANSLGWAVHLISRKANSHFKDKARLAARANEINFFKNLCLETNRLYPQANVVTRRALSEEMVDGTHIPKGTVLVIPIFALHRDPRYFKQPDEFNPERWEHDKVPPLMSYIPFTAGPRQCIGQSLFNRVGPLVLMRVFAEFSFTPIMQDVKPKWPNAVLPPLGGGFKMIATLEQATK